MLSMNYLVCKRAEQIRNGEIKLSMKVSSLHHRSASYCSGYVLMLSSKMCKNPSIHFLNCFFRSGFAGGGGVMVANPANHRAGGVMFAEMCKEMKYLVCKTSESLCFILVLFFILVYNCAKKRKSSF